MFVYRRSKFKGDIKRLIFAGFVVRMDDTSLPKCVTFGGRKKEWMGCLQGDLRAFGINADRWTTAAQDEGNGAKWRNKGRNVSRRKMDGRRESQGWTTACSSSIPERGGKDQGEDSPKQASLRWFASAIVD